MWGSVAAAAIAGGIFGGVLGGVAAADLSEEWELTLDPQHQGWALVGVHSEDKAAVEKAAGILQPKEPLSLDRYDREGRRLAG